MIDKKGNKILYFLVLIFCTYWAYNHIFWTGADFTLIPLNEQALFDAFGIYSYSKAVYIQHIHPLRVGETLWGPLPYYLYAIGLKIFGVHLSSIREVTAFFSGYWGAILYLILCFATKRPLVSFLIILPLIPFSGHINFHANRGYAHFYNFLIQATSLFLMLHHAKTRRRFLLLLVGLLQGISFGFKYEMSLIGLLAAFMVLFIFEAIDAESNMEKIKDKKGPNYKGLIIRLPKLLFLGLLFLYTLNLVRAGFLGQILVILWAAILAISFLELRLVKACWDGRLKDLSTIRALALNAAVLFMPFFICILLFFLHLWQMTDFKMAVDFFEQLANTPGQLTRMALSSSTFGANNAAYFWNAHSLSFPQVFIFFLVSYLVALCAPFLKNIAAKGLVAGIFVGIVFTILRIPNIKMLSMYHFMAAFSLLAWVYFIHVIHKSRLKNLQQQYVIYICFMAAGSLSLLRETASLDLNVWSVLPPVLGYIAFIAYSPYFSNRVFKWIAFWGFITVFYFAALNWVQVEKLNLVNANTKKVGLVKTVDDEIDLLMPADSADEMRKMKEYFSENLFRDEDIFVFSDHTVPYIFAPNGFPWPYMISFQVADTKKEERMLRLFREKKIKYVLISIGIKAYNSKTAAEMFPRLADYMVKNYVFTGKGFLNFLVYRKKT
jgi:hypothetical protein